MAPFAGHRNQPRKGEQVVNLNSERFRVCRVNRRQTVFIISGVLLALLALADGVHKLSIPPADQFDEPVGVAFILLSIVFLLSMYYTYASRQLTPSKS